MPHFMVFYVSGLVLALAVGFTLYFVIGGYVTPLLQGVFGSQAGRVWTRSFRTSPLRVAGDRSKCVAISATRVM